MAYEASGSGPAIVLVHGLPGSRRWWARNIPALAGDFRVYALDLPGFGESAGIFHFTSASRRLAGWMDGLGIERAVLVGHSLGGALVADLATKYPERVDRLVLVAPAIVSFDRPGMRPLPPPADLLRRPSTVELLFGVRDFCRAGSLTFASALMGLLKSDVHSRLSALAAQTLVVGSDDDPVIPAALVIRVSSQLPNARLAMVQGAGHNLMWTRPAAFNRLMCEFLQSPGSRHHGPPKQDDRSLRR